MLLDRRTLLALSALAVSETAAKTGSLPEAPFRSEKGWIPF